MSGLPSSLRIRSSATFRGFDYHRSSIIIKIARGIELTVTFHETLLVGSTLVAASLVAQSRGVVRVGAGVCATAPLLRAHREIERGVFFGLIGRLVLLLADDDALLLGDLDFQRSVVVHEDLRPVADDGVLAVLHRQPSPVVAGAQVLLAHRSLD